MDGSPLQIDSLTGRVTLPTGNMVGPELTRMEFLSGPLGRCAKTTDNATLLFLHGRFTAGEVEGHPLLANACFFEEMLVYLDMTISLYPLDAKDWSSYSLDTEAAIKSLHDRLLTDLLGPPSKTHLLPLGSVSPAQASLEKSLEWRFPWGKVWSSHDSKGGGTSFCVRYGDRLETANRLYRQRVRE